MWKALFCVHLLPFYLWQNQQSSHQTSSFSNAFKSWPFSSLRFWCDEWTRFLTFFLEARLARPIATEDIKGFFAPFCACSIVEMSVSDIVFVKFWGAVLEKQLSTACLSVYLVLLGKICCLHWKKCRINNAINELRRFRETEIEAVCLDDWKNNLNIMNIKLGLEHSKNIPLHH